MTEKNKTLNLKFLIYTSFFFIFDIQILVDGQKEISKIHDLPLFTKKSFLDKRNSIPQLDLHKNFAIREKF